MRFRSRIPAFISKGHEGHNVEFLNGRRIASNMRIFQCKCVQIVQLEFGTRMCKYLFIVQTDRGDLFSVYTKGYHQPKNKLRNVLKP